MKYGDVLHDTEDKDWWVVYGADLEKKFVEKVCPRIGLEAKINPKKEIDLTAPDLIVNNRLADLKTQNTPFFTVSRYNKRVGENKLPFDPTFTVTFNKIDYLRYRELYPNLDIYFWVHWKQTKYNSKNGRVINVLPISGVWSVNFQELMALIKETESPLHKYLRRKNDRAGNAEDSYIIDLRDLSEIAVF